MQNEKKYFLSEDSKLDGDSADFSVSTNAWVNSENVRTGSTDAGVIGTFESIGSTIQISSVDRLEDYLCIGTAVDEENRRFASLWYDNIGNNHKIECCYTDTDTIYKVLRSQEVFQKKSLVDVFQDFVYGQAPNILGFQNTENFVNLSVGDKIALTNTNGDGIYTISSIQNGYLETEEVVTPFTEYKTYTGLNIVADNNTLIIFGEYPNINNGIIPSGTQFDVFGTTTIDGIYDIEFIETYPDRIVITTDAGTPFPVPYAGTATIAFEIRGVLKTFNTSDYPYGLNFTKEPIHSARIVNGFLYWVDSFNNEPRKVNIEAGIKFYEPTFVTEQRPYIMPLLDTDITVIKPPPTFSPEINKQYDPAFLYNRIANDSFQFAFEYIYYDYEKSVIGTYSQASKLNRTAENFNNIFVLMSSDEYISDSIKTVNLVVRVGDGTRTGSTFAYVVKSWDKNNTDDFRAIYNHNVGVQSLQYQFYNDITGETISPDDVLRPFDNVPIYSQTLEVAKNRLFLANNTEGYDTPLYGSMTISQISTDVNGVDLTTNAILFRQRRFNEFIPPSWYNAWFYQAYVLFLSGTVVPQAGYYIINSTIQFGNTVGYPPPALIPSNVTYPAGLTFAGATTQDVLFFTKQAVSVGNEYEFRNTTTPVNVQNISPDEYSVFKSGGVYKYGMAFYDESLRKCGVYTNSSFNTTIPPRDFFYSSGISELVWEVSNGRPFLEIPDWAVYYAPVITMNQKTAFFIDSYTNVPKYVIRNNDGTFTYNNVYSASVYAIGLNTDALVESKLGYIYNEGDYCEFILKLGATETSYSLPVIGQSENYIFLKPQNIAVNLAPTGVSVGLIYEIYTPYSSSTNEPYYETGGMYRVENPCTENRLYGTTSGTFPADVFVLNRNYISTAYFAEGTSPNDIFYKRWDNDGGKVNFVTLLGRSQKESFVSWSDVFIPQSQINGLSTFRLFNEINVPQDCGAINKLQLTSKIQGEGTVMLSICSSETNSMYLQETQIVDSTGATQFFSASSPVISTINTLKGGFGTTNPESVTEFRGRVYYADANRGVWVQYAENGLFPISNYKMTRFWKLFFAQYISMTKAEIELLGSRPYLFSVVDPSHLELLISIPKLLVDPPKGYLPDYPSEVYPFDIWDGQTKTMVFCLENLGLPARWQGAYTYCADNYAALTNKLYSMKGKETYLNNQTGVYNRFYDVQNTSKVMIIANQNPQRPKVYNNVTVEANMKPIFVYMYNDFPYLQSSDLEDTDFRDLEGVYYSPIYRNKIVPLAAGGFTTDGLFTYEKMRNVAMKMMFEFEVGVVPLELKFLNIGYQISRGHTT
jgi:hypothetical protein